MLMQQMLLRRQLRKMAREGHDEARQVLRDPELFKALLVADDLRVNAFGNTVQGVQDWLDWLLENQDQILALIKRIIEMFSMFSEFSVEIESESAHIMGEPSTSNFQEWLMRLDKILEIIDGVVEFLKGINFPTSSNASASLGGAA